VEHGVDVDAQDNESIAEAALGGHLDVIKFLVEMGADVSSEDSHAVVGAACYGHLDVPSSWWSMGPL